MTEGLLGINDNRYDSAVIDLSGNNPSVASGDTSLCTREARLLRIALVGDTDFSGYEMIRYYGKIIESTMIPE